MDDWQAELLHDVDEDTFEKLDNMAADIDEMASRERWLALLQVLQGMAPSALQQDKQQVPDAEHSGAAASDETS
jgi:hypothetical protein